MEKSQDLLYMEKIFTSIKMKEDVEENLKVLSRICGRMFNLHITFHIVENKTNKFFGMSVYPPENLIDELVYSILEKRSKREQFQSLWGSNKEWFVDIDSLLLYDNNLMANPAEIVSVFLHEIGHVVYSDTVPMRINKVLRMKILELKYEVYQLCKDDKFKKMFNLVIVDGCSGKNFHSRKNLKKEVVADKFVQKYGYGDSLYNFIDKLLKSQGNSLIDRTEKDMENDIKIMSVWVIENIAELQYRKNKLRDVLELESKKQNSSYIKKTVESIRKKIFGEGRRDIHREMVAESMGIQLNNNYYDLETDQRLSKYVKDKLVSENLILDFFDKFGRIKKVSQSDIDVIRVEADRIENHDDKIYVLDRIYSVMVIIDRALEYIEMGRKNKVQQPKALLEDFKKQLLEIRQYVTTLKIYEKEYGVFIKYPKGYEG